MHRTLIFLLINSEIWLLNKVCIAFSAFDLYWKVSELQNSFGNLRWRRERAIPYQVMESNAKVGNAKQPKTAESNKSRNQSGVSIQYILVRVYPEPEIVRLVQIKLEIDPIKPSLIHTPLGKSAVTLVRSVDLAIAYWISIQIDWLRLHMPA